MNFVWRIINIFQLTLVALWTIICSFISTACLLINFNHFVLHIIGCYVWSPPLLWISGVTLKVTGREHLPKTPHIYVCNHESLLDIPVLMVATRKPLYFVAKRELAMVPFMGWIAWALGIIFIDRSNRQRSMISLKKAGEQVKKGKNVISFPEGTRTRTGELGLFKRGTFVMAASNSLPVVPIGLKGTREVVSADTFSSRPGTVRIAFGPSISSEGVNPLEVDEFASEVREVVQALREPL